MFCYGHCSCNKEYNWGLKGVFKFENKKIATCPDCKYFLVKKFDKSKHRKIKEPKIRRNPKADHGLKTKPKEYF